MTTYRPYGLTADAVVVKANGDPYPAAVCTVWTAVTGGTQITDLKVNDGSGTPGAAITSVTADEYGRVAYYAPDTVDSTWLDSPGSSTRTLMLPTDPATGAVASVTAGNGTITVAGTATDPTVAATVGTASGTVAAGDDSRITGAIPKSTVTAKGSLIVASGSAAVAELAVGANDHVLTADSAAATGVKWAQAATLSSDTPVALGPSVSASPGATGEASDAGHAHAVTYPPLVQYIPGYYYQFYDNGGAGSAGVMAANVTYLQPVYLVAGLTINHVGVQLDGAGGTGRVMEAGIYSTDPTTYKPKTRLATWGTTAADGTGIKTWTVSHAITATGWYWLALHIPGGTGSGNTPGWRKAGRSAGGGLVAFGNNNQYQATNGMNAPVVSETLVAEISATLAGTDLAPSFSLKFAVT